METDDVISHWQLKEIRVLMRAMMSVVDSGGQVQDSSDTRTCVGGGARALAQVSFKKVRIDLGAFRH